jgi:hypothetical protein
MNKAENENCMTLAKKKCKALIEPNTTHKISISYLDTALYPPVA